MRHRIFIMASVCLLIVVVAYPAMAKVIPTDTEVTVDGSTAIVTIDVDIHGGPASEEMANDLGYMVGLYPVESLDESGRPSPGDLSTPMEFQVVDDDTYRAVIEFPEGGEWAIVPFPFDPMMAADHYPTTTFTVPAPGIPLLGYVGLAVVVMLVAFLVTSVVVRGRWLQKPAPVTASGTSTA